MMNFEQLLDHFTQLGATNCLDAQAFKSQLQGTDVFIFDWDGVFNSGEKRDQKGSPFSEPDSMGTNLMRLSYFLKHKKMPKMGIITGAQNEGSKFLADREHFDFIIRGFHDKTEAITLLQEKIELNQEKTLFMWDDLIDFPIAKWAKTAIQVKRKAHPLFNSFMLEEGCTSYITSNDLGSYAVRELSEIYLSAMDNASETFRVRGEHDPIYSVYLEHKRAIETIEICK